MEQNVYNANIVAVAILALQGSDITNTMSGLQDERDYVFEIYSDMILKTCNLVRELEETHPILMETL